MSSGPRSASSDDGTTLTANVGGGVKWYAQNGTLGAARAETTASSRRSDQSAPVFFGQETPGNGHRVYGGIVIKRDPRNL